MFDLQTDDHPSPLKLIERRALCLEKLGRYEEATKDFIKLADQLKNDENSATKISEIEEKLKEFKTLNGVENGSVDPDEVKFNPNPRYPAFSDAVTIEYTSERGRFGVAARDIEVLLTKICFFINHQINGYHKDGKCKV